MEFNVNYLAVIAATVSAMVLGSLWYGPILGKQWMKETKMTDEDIKAAGGQLKSETQRSKKSARQMAEDVKGQ